MNEPRGRPGHKYKGLYQPEVYHRAFYRPKRRWNDEVKNSQRMPTHPNNDAIIPGGYKTGHNAARIDEEAKGR